MGVYKNRSTYKLGLEREGYDYIASGMYASVYGKPRSNTVLKIGGMDDAYPIYLQWAVENGYAGKFAPAVKSFNLHKTEDGGEFYVAEIERLPITVEDADMNSAAYDLYHDLRYDSHSFAPSRSIAKVAPEWVEFVEGLKALRRKSVVRFDLHDQNFMVRKNGELVLTDPFAESDGAPITTSTRRASTKLAQQFKH